MAGQLQHNELRVQAMYRPQGTVLRLRLIGSTSVLAGLVMLAVGAWCVTTLNGPSFNVNTFAGARPSTHDYILLVIEVAVTLTGAFSFLWGLVTLRKSRKQITFARSMHLVDAEFVTTPMTAASGYCWQCGSKIRAKSSICYICGAAQKRNASARRPENPVNQAGWDPASSLPGDVSPHFGLGMPAQPLDAPPYQPGAPPPWMPRDVPPDPPGPPKSPWDTSPW
jgi:hypothetical protein